jgi:hypothetical protein
VTFQTPETDWTVGVKSGRLSGRGGTCGPTRIFYEEAVVKHLFAGLIALTIAAASVPSLSGQSAQSAAPRAQAPAAKSASDIPPLPAGSAYTSGKAPAGWKVPRTADGHPDLQGVYSNNSVTPMTRPTQWRDKDRLTDAEVEELKMLVAKSVDQGGDAIFASVVQLALNAKSSGKFNQTSYDPTTGNYNQFWMSDRDWDTRTALIVDPPDGQMPARTPESMNRGRARTRRSGGGSRGIGKRSAWPCRWSRGSAVVRALHLVRRAAHGHRLQQLPADRAVAGERDHSPGNDPRRAHRADGRPSASRQIGAAAARRPARPLGR